MKKKEIKTYEQAVDYEGRKSRGQEDGQPQDRQRSRIEGHSVIFNITKRQRNLSAILSGEIVPAYKRKAFCLPLFALL